MPLIARRAAGLPAFITIDLSVRVSRFAFVIAALGYIFMPTRSAKRRQQPWEASLHYQQTMDRRITDGNPRSMRQKINRHYTRPTSARAGIASPFVRSTNHCKLRGERLLLAPTLYSWLNCKISSRMAGIFHRLPFVVASNWSLMAMGF